MDAEAVAAYRAVEAELPVVVGFLSHEDEQTVAAATWLVSWFPEQTATLPLVLATPPSTTRTLAAGLLGHVPERGGWAEAVAALCAGDVTAFDDVLAAAPTRKERVDETLPYLFGDIAGILAAALVTGPVERRAEAVAAMRVLADRVGRDRRHAVRYFLERAAVAT